MDETLQPQMEEFLSSYVSENSSVAYTSTKLLKEQLDSVRSMILVIGGLIGCIMAFVGLINFTNMITTNIITRRHEFATMQSIGTAEDFRIDISTINRSLWQKFFIEALD